MIDVPVPYDIEAIEKASPGIEIINAHKFINNIRLKKDANEIQNLREAVKIAEKTDGCVFFMI